MCETFNVIRSRATRQGKWPDQTLEPGSRRQSISNDAVVRISDLVLCRQIWAIGGVTFAKSGSLLRLGIVSMKTDPCKIYLVSLIRNEADICTAFLRRAIVLFDHIIVIDHQSTDGTRSILERFAAEHNKIDIIDYNYQGYYQAQVSTCVARHAFHRGADWVFFLDADEFIDVDNRSSFDALLAAFPRDVMYLRWANLIPTKFGSFTCFDVDQEFRWGGRVSAYGKIGLKASFVARHPQFYIHQGSHAVSSSPGQPPASMQDGSRVLHVPIRSLDRLRYKLAAGVSAYRAMAVRNPNEGFHWFELLDRLEQGAATESWINGVISHYGEPLNGIDPVDPVTVNWDVKFLPGLCQPNAPDRQARSLAETIEADLRQIWTELATVEGGMLRAHLDGNRIVLRPQPIGSDGVSYAGLFDRLSEDFEARISIDYSCIAEAISSAFERVRTIVPSGWTGSMTHLCSHFLVSSGRAVMWSSELLRNELFRRLSGS